MTDSQCAVFHFDVKTMSMRDAQGWRRTARQVCLPDLRQHDGCGKLLPGKIAVTPALGCRIYSHNGTVARTFADDQVYILNTMASLPPAGILWWVAHVWQLVLLALLWMRGPVGA